MGEPTGEPIGELIGGPTGVGMGGRIAIPIGAPCITGFDMP